MNYYNEWDAKAASWLRSLIDKGLLPKGYVDERSITEIEPKELNGYTQCHFFAGIGGWPYALQLAGVSPDQPLWTGSAPCQPFSVAGKGEGYNDERHLAPAWLDLIRKCRPPIIIGEQVASAASSKKHLWLDDLQDALEEQGYATGAAVLPACGVGAPHIRQRLFFGAVRMADSRKSQSKGDWLPITIQSEYNTTRRLSSCNRLEEGKQNDRDEDRSNRMDDPNSKRSQRHGNDPSQQAGRQRGSEGCVSGPDGASVRVADPKSERCRETRSSSGRPSERVGDGCEPVGMADAAGAGLERWSGKENVTTGQIKRPERLCPTDRTSTHNTPWANPDWLFCRDGKWRPVEPGTFPLAHGLPARVGRLRGYGNAIVPQVAAEFIGAFLESVPSS